MENIDAKQLIKKYLENNFVMMLSTVVEDKPQICTVHYAFDDKFNLYWSSSQNTNHSQALLENKKAAAGILESADLRQCIHFEGEASEVTIEEQEQAYSIYSERFGEDPERLKLLRLKTETKNTFYIFKPNRVILFDEPNFPTSPRKEIDLQQ